jgi:hypothetical protein
MNSKIIFTAINDRDHMNSALKFYGLDANNRINSVLIASLIDKKIALIGIGKLQKGDAGEIEFVKCWFDYQVADSKLIDEILKHLSAKRVVVYKPLFDFDFKKIASQFMVGGISRYRGKTYRKYEWRKT